MFNWKKSPISKKKKRIIYRYYAVTQSHKFPEEIEFEKYENSAHVKSNGKFQFNASAIVQLKNDYFSIWIFL